MPAYLKSIHSQLSAIFNHAIRYYRLQKNPAEIVGNMGKDSHKEMLFWTKDEYLKFAKAMMDKPTSYYAFEVLYWCGIRLGELLALTASDFNFERQTLTINTSLQNIKGNTVHAKNTQRYAAHFSNAAFFNFKYCLKAINELGRQRAGTSKRNTQLIQSTP